MIRIRTILVPTDFSTHAAKALEYATGLAKSLRAKIDLFHAYDAPLVELTPYHFAIPVSVLEEVRDAALEQLEELRQKVAADGVEAAAHMREGTAAEAISSAANDLGADLIVMGTRGLTGLNHVLLGSVAERTIRVAPCPVLTVKDPVEAE